MTEQSIDYIELRKLAEEARDSYTPGDVDITPEEERFYDEVTPRTFQDLLDRITELEASLAKVGYQYGWRLSPDLAPWIEDGYEPADWSGRGYERVRRPYGEWEPVPKEPAIDDLAERANAAAADWRRERES